MPGTNICMRDASQIKQEPVLHQHGSTKKIITFDSMIEKDNTIYFLLTGPILKHLEIQFKPKNIY